MKLAGDDTEPDEDGYIDVDFDALVAEVEELIDAVRYGTDEAPSTAQFANPYHDERGRFARKGEGRAVPTKGVDHDDGFADFKGPGEPDLDIPTAVIVPLDGAPGPGTTLTWADGSTMTMSGRDQPSPPWSGVEVPELHDAWVYVDAQGRTTNVQVFDDLTRYSWTRMPHENPPTMGPLGPDGPPAGFHLDAMKKCIDAKSDLVDRLGMDPVEMTFGHPATEASEAATNRLDPSTIHIGEVWGYRPGSWAARQEKNRNPPAHMGGSVHEMTVMRDVSQAEYIVAHELGHIRYNRGSTQPGTVLGALAQASGDGRLSGKYAAAAGLDHASRPRAQRLEEEPWDVYGTGKDGFSTYASQSEGEAIAETHAQLVLGGDMGPGPTVIAETLGWLP